MSKTLKPVPEFKTEAEERAFWESQILTIISTGARPSACACQT